ncbi:MAG: PH domain-containing protein [Peptostreptococcaceae bacterium]
MDYNKLSKGAIGCMFVSTLVELLVLSSILFVVWIMFGENWPQIIKTIMMGVVLINIIYLIISPKIRYERYRYSITEECIDVREGFIFIKRNIVPIERLHKIAIEKGPIDRMFNLAKVIVTTAGGDVTIRFLEDEKSEFIANSLKKKINEIAVESRQSNNEEL